MAQTSNKIVPAEFPPASFDGRQYVDSKGCVFIRAGVDGAVSWIPRMTRGRQQVCGFQPTLSAQARQPEPAPVTASAPAPRVVASAPPPQPVRSAPPAMAPASYRSAPTPVAAPAAPTPLPKVVQEPVKSAGPCQGATPLSTQYINSTSRYPIRCGPQTAPHVTYAEGSRTYTAPAPASATTIVPGSSYVYSPGKTYVTNPGSSAGPIYYTAGQVRVAPRHVYESQLASTDGVSVPEGYAPVWEDDRLNTRRAHQTFAGKAQMEKVWTKSVPQRMYRKPAGPTVTAETVPASSYSYYSTPSYSFAQNSAAGGQRDAVVPAPRQSAVVSHPSQQNGAVVAEAGDSRVKTTVSTRSAPAAEAPSHRYVQIGAFSDAGHAQRTAQKLASSGVRASMGKVSRDGKSYTLLLAGPFATQAELDSGLKRVRGMGYSEATLRR